ncbi:MAG: D-mannonate oxidoreductase, partial [Bacillota bacterium]
MELPFKVNLSDKIIALTGAGGVICGEFARALAACGAKVALLDINFDAAKKIADEIGENAVAVRCDCLNKESIVAAKENIEEAFGKVNFLINGAGGNNPRATCDNETMSPETDAEIKNFFKLEESGIKFVFDLNITTAFLVTQVFAEDMVKTGGNIINISSMNAYRPLT